MRWGRRMSEGMKDIDLALNSLSSGLGMPALRSSTRQAILMCLALNKKMRFTDLISLTGTGKGSLWNHIDHLERAGLVIRSKVSFFTSPRMYVEITPKGERVYEKLLDVIGRIVHESDSGNNPGQVRDENLPDKSSD